jgi:[FeFe] hydrogenase H-cluster maturation GTPase HydF
MGFVFGLGIYNFTKSISLKQLSPMSRDRRPHIGIYGRRNNGKSTLINCLTGQDIAIVSETAGTTTDPVKKSYEITGFGPVVLIDTAGIDDFGELGAKRVDKTVQTLKIVDLALLVITANRFDEQELKLMAQFAEFDIPFVVVHSKNDLVAMCSDTASVYLAKGAKAVLPFAAGQSIEAIVNAIKKAIPESAFKTPSLLGDLVGHGDIVLLITPIDIEAPEGRLILPQVQAIRDVLDNDAVCIVLKEREVDAFLRRTGIKPALVVTDSQVHS